MSVTLIIDWEGEDLMTSQVKQVAIVTGAGRGIGAGIARRLGQDGFHVVVVDLDAESARAVAAEIDEATAVGLDVTDQQAVRAAFTEIVKTFGRIDVVVNNAMWVHYAPLAEMTESVLDRMFAIAVKGAFWTIQAALPTMTAQGRGSIVNMSSPAATRGVDGSSAYSSVKGAVSSLTWQAARELGPQGIRVNGIIPGAVDTPGAREVVDDEGYEVRKKMNALGRLATPEDIAGAVSFLASENSRYVSGHLLAVDGAL